MKLPKRKNIRLKDYDYSQNGVYFITLCADSRKHLFGEIVGAALAPPEDVPKIILTEYGKKAKTHIEFLHEHYSEISVDKYVVMPNHIHMVIVINKGAASDAPTITLGNLVRGFKAGVSRECSFSLWQRGYCIRRKKGKKGRNKVAAHAAKTKIAGNGLGRSAGCA